MSTPGRKEQIRALLAGPRYGKLFATVRRRLEDAGEDTARSVTLRTLDADERRALADLYGWKVVPAGPVRVVLSRLDAVLRESRLGAGLLEVVEALGGALVDRKAERAAARSAAADLWARAAAHPVVAASAALRRWLEALRVGGLLTRAARASGRDDSELLSQAVEVAACLPGGGVLLSVLAAEVTGDAHALDPGQPLAGLVLRAAADLAGCVEVPTSAYRRRRLWQEVGVLCDPLSAHVLVFGLRPTGNGRLARHLRESSEAGEPMRVTLRELTRDPVSVPSGTAVFVCENPGVVATAADRLAERTAPLVCTDGVPSAAALALLQPLCDAGAVVFFHGDFDWGGLRIGNQLTSLFRGHPWRFGAEHYRRALDARVGLDVATDGVSLSGRPVAASWDPGLKPAMLAAGRAVYEEQVVEDLLADLSLGSGSPTPVPSPR